MQGALRDAGTDDPRIDALIRGPIEKQAPQVKQFAVLYLALGVTFPFVALWLAALTDTGNWIRILGVICGVGLTASSGFFLRCGSTDVALPGEPTLTLVLLLWPARHVASEFAALCDPTYVPPLHVGARRSGDRAAAVHLGVPRDEGLQRRSGGGARS
ncbi:MAG TPA: hypothetical protein VI011_22345 [Asanoa sp.]